MAFESDFETDNRNPQTYGWNLNKDEIFRYKIHVIHGLFEADFVWSMLWADSLSSLSGAVQDQGT